MSLRRSRLSSGATPLLTEPVSIVQLLSDPDRYVGKRVQVQGRVGDVCPKAGCWIEITADDGDRAVRFKVEDGVIVFPMEAKGKRVSAEGIFTRIEMTEKQALSYAKHLAEEKGQPFDPDSFSGPRHVYQILGAGAVVE